MTRPLVAVAVVVLLALGGSVVSAQTQSPPIIQTIDETVASMQAMVLQMQAVIAKWLALKASLAPVDATFSEWTLQSATDWSVCQNGTQTRTETWVRERVTPPLNGGADGPTVETRIGTQTCTVPTPPPPPPPDGDTNTWTVFTPTFSFPDNGRYNSQQWHAQPVDDPATGTTIIFDRVNDDVRSQYPSSIYANDFIGIDPVAKQVSSVVSSHFRVVPCKPALPEYSCLSPTLTYETQPIPNTTPTYVDGHPLAGNLFDPVTRTLLRVNGANTSAQPYTGGHHPRQTWAIDLNTGIQRLIADADRGDPHPLQDVGDYSCGIFDAHAKKYLYFDVTNTGMDTWVLDLTVPAPKWILRPRDPSATNLWKAVTGCAYDSTRRRVLMLGGGRSIYQPLGTGDPLPEADADIHPNRQTFHAYSYETNTWEVLPSIPHTPNIAPEAAYSPVHDVLLVVVRQQATNSVEMLYDTWAFRFADQTWTRVATGFARGRVGVRGHSGTLSWNSKAGLFVMTGGTGPAPIFATLTLAGAVDPTPPPPPPPDPDPEPEPPAEEVCGNAIDDDGDGQVDEGCEVLPPPPPSTETVRIGPGCTTAWYHDVDCDGYGTGVRSSGIYGDVGLGDKVDADDTDPTLNTAASVLARYDANQSGILDPAELKVFLAERKGLTSVGDVYYVSPTGDNATGVVNDPLKPFRTYNAPLAGTSVYGVRRFLKVGDAVIYRGGVYEAPRIGSTTPPLFSGEPGRPSIVMAAPGEFVVLNDGGAIGTQKSQHVVVEGFAIDNPVSPGLGSGLNVSLTKNAIVRNIEVQRVNWVTGMQDMHDLVLEGLVIHHNKEHGLYLGSRNLPNHRVTVRRLISYRNGIAARYGGMQFNGRFFDSTIEQSIIHSNGQWCLTFAMGVMRTRVQNNLCFNNAGHGIILQMYPGHGYDLCTDDPAIPNDVEPTVAEPICPHEQSDNVFVNNTIWLGRYNQAGIVPIGGAPSNGSAIRFGRNSNARDDPATEINEAQREIDWLNSKPQARNTVQNNIIVTDNGVILSEIDPLYLDTWPITNNVFLRVGGDVGTFERGSHSWSLADFQQTFPLASGNVFADPRFVAASMDFWNTPHLFNFRLQAGSPAIGFGLTTLAPTTDVTGALRVAPLDAGAYRK